MSDPAVCFHLVPVFGCDGCRNRRDLGHPPRPFPEWYRPAQDRKTQNKNVARGLHPMGLFLLGRETCGTCSHMLRHKHSKTYLKCDLVKNTHGPATDIRAKWAACEKWGPA